MKEQFPHQSFSLTAAPQHRVAPLLPPLLLLLLLPGRRVARARVVGSRPGGGRGGRSPRGGRGAAAAAAAPPRRCIRGGSVPRGRRVRGVGWRPTRPHAIVGRSRRWGRWRRGLVVATTPQAQPGKRGRSATRPPPP